MIVIPMIHKKIDDLPIM